MFCDGCGTTMQPGQAFCSRCGKQIVGPVTVTQSARGACRESSTCSRFSGLPSRPSTQFRVVLYIIAKHAARSRGSAGAAVFPASVAERCRHNHPGWIALGFRWMGL